MSELPKRIKHKISGNTLEEYRGPKTVLDLQGGVIVTINPGDYVGFNCHATPKWLRDNPDQWCSLS